MKNKARQSGFTLIEVIATLILMGIIGLTMGMGIVQLMNGYLFSKKNAEISRKARLAMTRLVKELKNSDILSSPALPSATFIKFSSDKTYQITWIPGNSLTLNNGTDEEPLTDDVSDFGLTYYDSYNSSATAYSSSTSLIGITLKLKGAKNMILTFENRVFLRKE
jgi:prepilin-type N-terminal cleavage/methylation domain-containing protein